MSLRSEVKFARSWSGRPIFEAEIEVTKCFVTYKDCILSAMFHPLFLKLPFTFSHPVFAEMFFILFLVTQGQKLKMDDFA